MGRALLFAINIMSTAKLKKINAPSFPGMFSELFRCFLSFVWILFVILFVVSWYAYEYDYHACCLCFSFHFPILLLIVVDDVIVLVHSFW